MDLESIRQIDMTGAKPAALELVAIYSSLGLLLVSCSDQDWVAGFAKLLWLASVAGLSVMNFGAAFGVYVASAAIYSVLHFKGWGSVFQRPDNFALAILLFSLGVTRFRPHYLLRSGWLGAGIVVFMVYSLAQMVLSGSMTRVDFAWHMRMFGLPFLVFLFLMSGSMTLKDLLSFFHVMIAIGLYMGIISIMERFSLYSYMIPPWIGDPNLNVSIEAGRSGGLLLQSEWNGFVLGLIYSIILASIYLTRENRWPKYIVAIICLLAIFFTYTRAAWLGAFVASLLLLFNTSSLAKKEWMKKFAVLFSGFLVVAMLILFPSKTAMQRTQDEATIYFRINLWSAGLKMMAEKALFGHGFGKFRERIYEYHEKVKGVPYTPIPREGSVAHNTLINILVEQGLMGLTLYCLIFVLIFLKAKATINRFWPTCAPLWLATFAAVYLINTQFIAAYEPATNFIFYGTMGFLIGSGKEFSTGKQI